MKKLLKVTTIIIATVFSAIFYFSCSKDASSIAPNTIQEKPTSEISSIVDVPSATDRCDKCAVECVYDCLDGYYVSTSCCDYKVCVGCYRNGKGATGLAIKATPTDNCMSQSQIIVENLAGMQLATWVYSSATPNTSLVTYQFNTVNLFVVCNGQKILLGTYNKPCK
jgi:hypothetical protein